MKKGGNVIRLKEWQVNAFGHAPGIRMKFVEIDSRPELTPFVRSSSPDRAKKKDRSVFSVPGEKNQVCHVFIDRLQNWGHRHDRKTSKSCRKTDFHEADGKCPMKDRHSKPQILRLFLFFQLFCTRNENPR